MMLHGIYGEFHLHSNISFAMDGVHGLAGPVNYKLIAICGYHFCPSSTFPSTAAYPLCPSSIPLSSFLLFPFSSHLCPPSLFPLDPTIPILPSSHAPTESPSHTSNHGVRGGDRGPLHLLHCVGMRWLPLRPKQGCVQPMVEDHFHIAPTSVPTRGHYMGLLHQTRHKGFLLMEEVPQPFLSSLRKDCTSICSHHSWDGHNPFHQSAD